MIMSELINFKNEFGTLSVSLVTDFLAVRDINRNIKSVSDNLFDMETAEKIALITGNKRIQLVMCYPLNGQCYMVYHQGSSLAAVCKIESMDFHCDRAPAAQIDLMYQQQRNQHFSVLV